MNDIERAERLRQAITQAKTEINEDIARGIVPGDVAGFSALHDYVDANCYGGLCDEGDEGVARVLNYADWIAFSNDMQDVVHAWLAAGRPEG